MRLLFVLLFSASLFAGEWTINDFTIRGKQFTQSATGILQGNLNRIPSYKAPKGDELLLRRRLDMNNYGLYVGKAEASAYTNLSRFTKPAGMSMDKLLKMKFFKDETPTGYNDVADIYFQGEYIYVKNLVRIFYKENGSWKSLEVAQGAKPGVLEISSTPSGATVTIDGVVKGKTPYTFVMDAPTVEVEVRKSGYYSQSFTADAKPGAVKKYAQYLNKKIKVATLTDPFKMVDTSLTEISDVEARIKEIASAKVSAEKQEKIRLANFEKSFPKLSPRDEFELHEEFAEREAAYKVEKAEEKKKITVNYGDYKLVEDVMVTHLELLDEQMYDLYLPINSMELGKYDIDKFEFPVTIRIKQGAFDFTFSGRLPMTRDIAKKFKFSSSEKGLKVTYGKRLAAVSISGRKQKKYFKYGTLMLPFEGNEYELKGTVTLPIVVSNSQEVKTYKAKLVEIARKERLERERLEKERLEREYLERMRLEKERLERERLERARLERARLEKLRRGMKKIPSGSFMMGALDGRNDEKPVHHVTVTGFWMDSTEVTQAEYQRLMGDNPSYYKGSNNPVETVSWWDAVLYCNKRSNVAGLDTVYIYSSNAIHSSSKSNKLFGIKINYLANGYRLPTEAEWEYACRGGSNSKYYWGDGFLSSYCWYTENSNQRPQPVALKMANGFGLYDMVGNVHEWCNDWYNSGYYKYSPNHNPQGPSQGTNRVTRGGCYGYGISDMRSADRSATEPDFKHWPLSSSIQGVNGFRCVLPIRESY